MAGFQNTVTVNPAYAVEGDFASDNPRANVLNSPEDGLTAGANGVTIGRFAWVNQANQTASNNGTGVPDGFVARHTNALINALTEEASMLIPAGRTLALHSKGDFWAKTKTVPPLGKRCSHRLRQAKFPRALLAHQLAGTLRQRLLLLMQRAQTS